MVDGLKNKITECIESAEKKLDDIENHYVNIEKARIAQLHSERLESLKPFEYIESGLAFGGMPEADWNHYFTGVKTAYETKKAEALALKQKEEQDRLDRIKLEQDNAKLKEDLQKAEQKVEVAEKKVELVKTELISDVKKLSDLQHFYDSSVGLWCTDRPDMIPEDIKHIFFQLK